MGKKIFTTAFILILFASFGKIYSDDFSVENYVKFLNDNQDMTNSQLQQMYPPGIYLDKALNDDLPEYADSIFGKYGLTNDEKEMLEKYNFVVSGRDIDDFSTSFGHAYSNIWHNDLPLFITSDAFLHAFHMSYDQILKYLETEILIDELDGALSALRNDLGRLDMEYGSDEIIKTSLMDMDVYYTIAHDLLTGTKHPCYFSENESEIAKLMQMINNEKPGVYKLFSTTARTIDFSQFTPRGHYTDTEVLKKYFKSMIWLGRTEFYLIAPKSDDCPKQTPEDIRRQIIGSYLIAKSTESSGAGENLDNMDAIITTMVGESDNVKVNHMIELAGELSISGPRDLTSLEKCEEFKDLLKTKSYAGQKILSQILMSDPLTPDQIEPASAFMLFGQRFVIDSYVFSNVVYDRILFENKKVMRMMPSSLDVIFALGNNAASYLLKDEMEEYPYGSNLAAMRYLIDSYKDDFWTSSIYNSWLNVIRTLNAPEKAELKKFPEFMQTANWQQSQINTQLASWAQLRHDNLLYAKQSYTGGATCSFPHVFLEPNPDLYKAFIDLSQNASDIFKESLEGYDSWRIQMIFRYLDNMKNINDTCYTISTKMLAGDLLSDAENGFLGRFYSESMGCVVTPTGWYADLYLDFGDAMNTVDYVVADVHTQPTDEAGNPVGKVLHVGTGPLNLCVIYNENEDGEETAYVGPVMSYYEHISLNFKRLTDEIWTDNFTEEQQYAVMRPEICDLYQTDDKGAIRSNAPLSLPTVATGVEEESENPFEINSYPNPFVESTTIFFRVDSRNAGQNVTCSVYDISGRKLADLHNGSLPARNYSLEWNGCDATGMKLSSGTYIVNISVGGKKYSETVVLNR